MRGIATKPRSRIAVRPRGRIAEIVPRAHVLRSTLKKALGDEMFDEVMRKYMEYKAKRTEVDNLIGNEDGKKARFGGELVSPREAMWRTFVAYEALKKEGKIEGKSDLWIGKEIGVWDKRIKKIRENYDSMKECWIKVGKCL